MRANRVVSLDLAWSTAVGESRSSKADRKGSADIVLSLSDRIPSV